MADFLPPVIAILKGDIKDFSQKMGEARKQMGATAGSGEKSAEQTKKAWTTGALAIGGAAVGLGAVLVKAGQAQERAGIVLRRVIENQGLAFKDYEGAIEQTEDRMRKFGHQTAETRSALAKLTLATKDPNRAMEGMQLAADIAAAKQISLGEAAGEVRKIMQGNTKVLKQYGVSVGDAKEASKEYEQAQKDHATAVKRLEDAQLDLSDLQEVLSGKDKLSISEKHRLRDATKEVADAQAGLNDSSARVASTQTAAEEASKRLSGTMDEVGKKMKSIADDQAKTFSGRMEELKTVIQDKAATAGEKLSGVLNGLSQVMTIVAALAIPGVKAGLGRLATVAAGAAGALGMGAAVAGGVGLGFAINWLVEKNFPTLHAAMSQSEGVFASFVRWAADATSGTMSFDHSLDLLASRLNKTWMSDVTDFLNNVYAKSGILQKIAGDKPSGGGNLFRTGAAVPRTAEGGIVTSPQVRLVGEAGPEAIIPLNRALTSGTNVYVTIQGSYYGEGGERDLANKIQRLLLQKQRGNPSLGLA